MLIFKSYFDKIAQNMPKCSQNCTMVSKKLQTTIREVGGRQLLINTQTGETIRDLGAVTTKPTTGDTKITDQDRVIPLNTFFDSRRGEDNLIAAESYIEAQQAWIASGGTITDFKAAYPPETLMREFELKRLPSSIFKQSTGSNFDLSNEGLVE